LETAESLEEEEPDALVLMPGWSTLLEVAAVITVWLVPDDCPIEDDEVRDVSVSAPTFDDPLGDTLPDPPWFEDCEEELLPLVPIAFCPFAFIVVPVPSGVVIASDWALSWEVPAWLLLIVGTVLLVVPPTVDELEPSVEATATLSFAVELSDCDPLETTPVEDRAELGLLDVPTAVCPTLPVSVAVVEVVEPPLLLEEPPALVELFEFSEVGDFGWPGTW
jgi:hypothetical protein